jgi:acyl-CoA thioester hydrolase
MAKYIETFRGVVYPIHVDQMGHMNVQHYVGMYDQSSIHLFLPLGVTPDYMAEHSVGFADVKHEIEYRAELRVGDAVRGVGRLLSIGNKSLRHEHIFYDAATDEIAATFEVVSVFFDLAARKALVWPDDLRARAEALIAEQAD